MKKVFKKFAGFWNKRVRTRVSSNWGKFELKTEGMTILLPTIILSGLILVVGLGLSRVLMTELEFSADLLFSEKAYFAAESGVEKSLLALKDKPLNLVHEEQVPVGNGATYDLDIFNSVRKFPLDISPNESIKFRLGVDRDKSFAGYSLEPITNFEITKNNQSGNSDLHWNILCENNISLFGTGSDFASGNLDDGTAISDENGNITYATQRVSTFLSSKNQANNLCFMSLTNFGEGNFRGIFKVTPPSKIAPAKVRITATGKSFSREKIVSFEYWQKNLSALYDLGLYFTENN